QALRAYLTDGFYPHTDAHADLALWRSDRLELLLPGLHRFGGTKADLLELLRKFLREEIEHLLGLGRARSVFDAGIDVFRVLPDDHDVDFLGMFHRRGHAVVPAYGTETDEQVQELTQRDVQRSDPTANRRGQRTFDADEIVPKRFDRFVGQPVVEL